MTLPFALLLPLVFLRARRPFMTHGVFSLHLYTFLLLLFCAAWFGEVSALLGFGGLDAPMVDNALSIASLTMCTWTSTCNWTGVWGMGATGLSKRLRSR